MEEVQIVTLSLVVLIVVNFYKYVNNMKQTFIIIDDPIQSELSDTEKKAILKSYYIKRLFPNKEISTIHSRLKLPSKNN